MGSLYAVSRQ